MSRCFLFPPPGYEKKDRPIDENLLEKEKRNEKKHKKGKKDKSKKDKEKKKDKEGKQKKGKESSEDKHRKKKDRKERYKHKKDKNKKKEKEKKGPSEDEITAGPPECSTVDNPGSSCTQSDETSDIKFLVELGKRIRDDDKISENVVVKKNNLTGKICSEYPEKEGVRKNGNSDGNVMLTERRINDRKFCGQSNNSNVRGTESGIVHNFVVGQQRKVEGAAGLIGKNIENRMMHNKIDERSSSESRGDRSNERDQDGKRKSTTERKSEMEPNKEQLPMAREKKIHAVCNDSNTGSSSLPNESNKHSNLGKRKELRLNGFLHDDEILPSKLQRPFSCAKAVVEDGHNLKPTMTLTKSVPLVDMVNHHRLNSKLPFSHRNTEDIRVTSSSHEVNNSVPSSHPTLENGRTLDTLKGGSLSGSECYDINHTLKGGSLSGSECYDINHKVYKTTTLTEAGEHEASGHSKVANKEQSINGLVKDKRPNGSSTMPSSSTIKRIVGEYPKPPHRDSKYLSKILAIPTIEWFVPDEEEWLLDNTGKSTKTNTTSTQFEETKQVWDKALHLDYAEIIALPYVIPY